MIRLTLGALTLLALAAGVDQLAAHDRPPTADAAPTTTVLGDVAAASAAGDAPAATLPAPPQESTDGEELGETEPALVVSPPRIVRIPAIEVEADIIDLGLEPDGALETPTDFAQAGWWAGGTTTAEPGPAVIVGHVDDYTGPAVFFRLGELAIGDEIEVVDGTGAVSRFAVTELATYDKDEFPTDRVYGPTEEPTLRLITCGGDFDASERSYEANVVIYADPI